MTLSVTPSSDSAASPGPSLIMIAVARRAAKFRGSASCCVNVVQSLSSNSQAIIPGKNSAMGQHREGVCS